MISAPFATNNTVAKREKLPENGTVIRKLSFVPQNLAALSLVTAVQFSNGQEVLFIDYSDSKHACPALPILRDVITSISFRNGHKAPPKSLGRLRLREPRRQPLQKFAQKTPQPTALKLPSTARTAGRSDWAERRFRRQPFILLSFSSSKKARKAQETQSYQRF